MSKKQVFLDMRPGMWKHRAPRDARSARAMAARYIGPTPWANTPTPQPPEVIIAEMLRRVGFGWKQIPVAMTEGSIGGDGWFELEWCGVTVRFPASPPALKSVG